MHPQSPARDGFLFLLALGLALACLWFTFGSPDQDDVSPPERPINEPPSVAQPAPAPAPAGSDVQTPAAARVHTAAIAADIPPIRNAMPDDPDPRGEGRGCRRGDCYTHPLIPSRYDLYFRQAARRYFPLEYKSQWYRVKAQCFEESGLRVDAVSPAGAVGACQFMAATWDEITNRHHIEGGRRNPYASIQAAAAYDAQLLRILTADRGEDPRWDFVLILYNWGPGNTIRQVFRVYGSPATVEEVWDALPAETRGYILRNRETQDLLRSR